MDLRDKYSIYTGSVRGILSYSNLDSQGKLHHEFPEEAAEITSMIWGRNDNEIIVGFKTGIVSIYDSLNLKYTQIYNCLKNNHITGLGCLNKKILTASNNGTITLLDSNDTFDSFKIFPEDHKEISTLDGFAQNKNKKEIIAVAGENNDLKLWNVETKQCVFKAKSLGHDMLNLPIKASIRDISFISEAENVCCCVSKEGHVLLYDERVQRKPIMKYFEAEASFTCCVSSSIQRNVLVGTTKGYVQYIDMKNGKCLKTFTNIGGSVKSLSFCDQEQLLAVASLDRYLRIFDLNTKEVLYKQYMKQSLTKLLMKPVVKKEIIQNDVENEMNSSIVVPDDEYEEIFENMEVVTEKSNRKRNPLHTPKEKSKRIKK